MRTPIGFADLFKAQAIPRITPKIRSAGANVGLGLVDLAAANGTIMVELVQLGAAMLPEGIMADLEDWVLTELAARAYVVLDAVENEYDRAESLRSRVPTWMDADPLIHCFVADRLLKRFPDIEAGIEDWCPGWPPIVKRWRAALGR